MYLLFRSKNPDCFKKYFKVHHDQYNKLVFEALGGKGALHDLEKEDKMYHVLLRKSTIR